MLLEIAKVMVIEEFSEGHGSDTEVHFLRKGCMYKTSFKQLAF